MVYTCGTLMTFTKKFSLSLLFFAYSLMVSCSTIRPDLDLIPTKQGVGSVAITFTNPLRRSELIFDGYTQVTKAGRIKNIELDEVAAGKHYLRIYSGNWDTMVTLEVLPHQENVFLIASPR
jgi:hypothetical protein